MDMQMPVMDGYEATGMIRNNPAWSDLPILAITANSLSGDKERCLACGCTSYLSKPFKTEQLIAEIKQLLSHKTFKGKHSEIQSQQLIEELMPEFMEMLAKNLDELEDAISTKNLVGIKSISHNLKGTAGMYGFMKVSDLAAHMETAARDKNYGKMNSLYQQIIALVQNIKNQQNSVGFS